MSCLYFYNYNNKEKVYVTYSLDGWFGFSLILLSSIYIIYSIFCHSIRSTTDEAVFFFLFCALLEDK